MCCAEDKRDGKKANVACGKSSSDFVHSNDAPCRQSVSQDKIQLLGVLFEILDAMSSAP
jgi:hypothetical protein